MVHFEVGVVLGRAYLSVKRHAKEVSRQGTQRSIEVCTVKVAFDVLKDGAWIAPFSTQSVSHPQGNWRKESSPAARGVQERLGSEVHALLR